jgi:prepilin-type N-terminal cleavage/methylation domain-containing protein
MKGNKKIKGFTLVEMLVTMSLSAVAIVCAYLAYNSIFGSFANYQKMNAELQEYTNLCRFTQSLLQNAEIMRVKDNELIFINKDGYTTKLELKAQDAIILPPESDPDTFSVHLGTAEYYFDEKKIENEGNVSRFILNMELNKQPFSLTFEKLYDAETLMRLDSLAQTQIP